MFHSKKPEGFHFFFFNDTATTEIYTLSLHDALPISDTPAKRIYLAIQLMYTAKDPRLHHEGYFALRSEEHTSELQPHLNLVCRLLLEKKNSSGGPRTNHPGPADATLATRDPELPQYS